MTVIAFRNYASPPLHNTGAALTVVTPHSPLPFADYAISAASGQDPDAAEFLAGSNPDIIVDTGIHLLAVVTSGSSSVWVSRLRLRAYYLLPVSVTAAPAPTTGTTTQYPLCSANLSLEVESWQTDAGPFLTGGDVELRIYKAADAPGAEPPAGITPVWTGLPRFSEATVGARTPSVSAQCTVPLENGDYKLYARASRDLKAGSGLYWSAWTASAVWTQAVPNPDPPTALTVATDDVGQRMSITATAPGTTGYDSATAKVEVQRQVDGVWRVVRGMSALPVAVGSPQLLGYDYEAERGESNSYRARVSMLHTVDAVTRYSTWTEASAAGPVVSGWNLKAVEQVASSWLAAPVASDPPEEDQGEAAVFKPLGRPRPVVVHGVTSGAGGAFSLTAVGASEIAAAEALREYRGLILLETAFGDAKYVALTGMSWVRQGTASAPRRTYSFTYAEVGCDLEAGS